jgi:hypothetical protein
MSSKPIPGRKRGRPPGQPKTGGRKKGTPNRVTNEVKSLAQVHGPDIIDELYRIAKKSKADSDRVAAIKELLNRGYGRPANPIHLGGYDGGPLDITLILKAASPDQVRAFIQGLTLEHKVLLSQKLLESIAAAEGRTIQ